ncbi:protein CEBPZOS [Uranotaenia lowii]|uniref:protein CEBPZOS n=1 Tax=Uranotaenia lowii TaxID=190385 RepID=UPI00247A43CC|nr:protein CEBPZOS [Uranotaenia lowii]
MLHKNAKPNYRRTVKTIGKYLLAAEAIGCAVTFAGWYRLNTNRDFRHYIRENYPLLLEGYYQVGEYISGDRSIRNHDDNVWNQEQKTIAINPPSNTAAAGQRRS